MSRLEIALMVAVMLVIGIAGRNERVVTRIDCNKADDAIACLLRAVDQ